MDLSKANLTLDQRKGVQWMSGILWDEQTPRDDESIV